MTLSLFGSPSLAEDGIPVDLPSRKALALLAYLAVTGVRHRRSALAAMFWPESDRERAQNVMRYTLSLLRRALKGRWLAADRETAGLDGSQEDAVDVLRFRSLLALCRTHGHGVRETCPECLPVLSEAVKLCRGDFLAGFTLRDSVEFDMWQSLEAEALRQELVGALRWLVEGLAGQGETEQASAYAKRWLALEPLDEAAHRALMRLYAGSGQQTAALRQYETCERVLKDELGVSPGPDTRELYQAIREGRAPQLPVSCPAVAEPVAPPRHNLPPQPTPFVGREQELAQIAQRLADPACRLLTVVGPGGMGKSRLAIQAGEKQLPAFNDGVWFVPLAALGSADLLPSAIMQALDVTRRGGQDPQTQLLNYLRERNLLLILDNFEHLLEATTLITEMLAEASGLTLLVTSRERLNLRGEWLLPLQGMGVPGEEALLQLEDDDIIEQAAAVLEGYSAVDLFVQCAQQVQPGFSLASVGPAPVARICRLVEGMPLAIELAAPWVRMMDCEEIVREIEASLGFLATTLRDVPQRHRSIRAVFNHSWDLLPAEEQSVLRKLSVFRGGFRREAAEAVAGASLLTLTVLLDGSWVHRSPSGRYELRELTRQYCDERLLQDRDASKQVRDRHSDYYAAFLDEQEPRLKGRHQVEALEIILEEIGNIRAAWDWAVERGSLEVLHRCVDSLYLVGLRRGWWHEVMQSLGEAIAMLREQLLVKQPFEPASPAGGPGLLLGRILCRQGHLTLFLGGITEQTVALLEESLALLQGLASSVRQQKACAFTKARLGWFLGFRGESSRARALLQDALSQATEVGDDWNRAFTLWVLSMSPLRSGEYAESEGYLRQAIAVGDRLGDQWRKAWCLHALSDVLRMTGEYEEAESAAQEELRIRRELGDPQGIDSALMVLGHAEAALGKYEQASQHYHDGLAFAAEYGGPTIRYQYLFGMGTVAAGQGAYAEAAELLEEAATLARDMGDLQVALRAFIRLGHAVSALGKTQRAAECFRQASREAMKATFTATALGALVGVASLSAGEGELKQAAELIALALHHHATHHEDRVRAQELLAELESELPPDALAAATERGQARGLEEVVTAILSDVKAEC